MTRNAKKPSQNIYEVLEPLSGAKQDLIEPEAMSLIKGVLNQQKREQNRRSLPDLTPIETPEPEMHGERTVKDTPHARLDRPTSSERVAVAIQLFKQISRYKIGLMILLCVLFLSGFFSTAMMFAAVFALLFIMIFGPEPVLDAFFPNWRTSTVNFGKLRFSAWGKR